MTPRALALGLLAASLVCAGPSQAIDPETWARLLVDHPLARAGYGSDVVASWLELVAEEPGHPLAEAALRLADQTLDHVEDPERLAGLLADLELQGLLPAAERQLAVLRGRLGARRVTDTNRPTDRFPGWLRHVAVLGPLGPVGHPYAVHDPPEALHSFSLDQTHPGVDGPVRWRSVERAGTTRFISPGAELHAFRGQAVLAARFDVPGGGPGWIEIDVGDETHPSSRSLAGGGRRAGAAGSFPASSRGSGMLTRNPSYALAINDARPRVVDRLSERQSALCFEPVVLRSGRNVLRILGSLSAGTRFSVRVLDEEGRPWPGLREARGDVPLGKTVDAAAPTGQPASSERFLAELSERGPDTEALLGLLQFLDGRGPTGLAHLRAAAEAVPGRAGLTALLSRAVGRAGYLPRVWRRNRARALAEQALRMDSERLDMGVFLAGVLASEDRDEEAVERLVALGQIHGRQVRSLLELHHVYRGLEMEAEAERVLREAASRAPDDPEVLAELARHYQRVGQERRALELSTRRLRVAGATATEWTSVGQAWAERGDMAAAESMLRSAVVRSAVGGNAERSLARFLAVQRRFGEADIILEALTSRYPDWADPRLDRADLAFRQDDHETERIHLRAAMECDPSRRSIRDRLRDLGGTDPAQDLFARYGLDGAQVRARYGDGAWDESVVHVLDESVVKIFSDGSLERFTHDIVQVRDLDGCAREGEVRLSGEVLKVATLKGTSGTEFEPVRVAGQYVMPSLEPGDFIETLRRRTIPAPLDGIVRPGAWYFASTEEPYFVSRYVISVPKNLSLRMVVRHFDGVHEQIDEGDAVVHVFEVRERNRVHLEPGSPPTWWFLPWVEFGVDRPRTISTATLRFEVAAPCRVTPEIRARASEMVTTASGQQERARALHAFVATHLDQRYPWSRATATQALLSREGQPAYLYACLLAAEGIPHELVWSRDQAPDSDADPDPAFVDADYWRGRLLVLVQPDDGPEAWCDLSSRTMPYGKLLGTAPGAPAYATATDRFVMLPRLALHDRPGLSLDLTFRLEESGDAQITGMGQLHAGIGFQLKEAVREIPETYLKYGVAQAAGQIVPGVDVEHYDLAGLDDPSVPLTAAVRGRVRSFLDDDGTQLTCKLPFPALDLGSQFVGEGIRRLPFFLSSPVVQLTQARLELPEGLVLQEYPPALEQDCQGGTYRLVVDPDGPGAWTIRREVLLAPFSLSPEEHASFAEFCARVDEVERTRLRFVRVGAVDPSGMPR